MKRCLLLMPLVGALGCEQVSSTNINTEGIYAEFRAVSDGSGQVETRAWLKTGGAGSNTYLELEDGDTLTASSGAQTLGMSKHESLGVVSYSTTFQGDEAGKEIRVSFARKGHDEADTECRGGDAPNSVVSMPSPFTILAPVAMVESRRGAALELSWAPGNTGDAMTWSITGPCIFAGSGTIANEPGHVTIPANTLRPLDEMMPMTCDVTLSLTRSRRGLVDSAYGEGGMFVAEQVRSVQFRSLP